MPHEPLWNIPLHWITLPVSAGGPKSTARDGVCSVLQSDPLTTGHHSGGGGGHTTLPPPGPTHPPTHAPS